MGKFIRVDQETYLEETAEERARMADKRLRNFVDSLENQPIEMDMTKETDESVDMGKYVKNANAGLKAILAKAAADEARARGQE